MSSERFKEYLIRRISNKECYHDLLEFPRYLEIETVNACNARCPMCTITSWNNNAKPMSDELFEKIASELAEHADTVKRVSLYRNGEPLLDKKLASRIARLNELGVSKTAISTNVSLLTESRSRQLLDAGIDLIIMSIDSLDRDVYESIRVGLVFDEVMNNAARFIQLRNSLRPETRIWMRMIRQEGNRNEWKDYHAFWTQRLAEHDRVYYHNIFNWGGQLDNFDPVENSFEPNLPCVALWSLVVINANGDVPLCNVDFKQTYTCGNITTTSIKELWQSKQLDHVRHLHVSGNKREIDICKNCNVWDEAKDTEHVSSQYADDIALAAARD